MRGDDFRFDRTPDWRFRSRIEKVTRWMRSCAICASMLPPIDVVCEECIERLWLVRNGAAGARPLGQSAYPFPVYSLFTWTEKTDTLLRPLVHAMKGGWSPEAIARFAEWFVFERSLLGDDSFAALVPAPSKRFDHAKAWAEALSRGVGSPIMDVLQKGPDQVRYQRSRSRVERADLRFEVNPSQIAYRGPLLFVDDVITTGSTAMAAYMALGDPKGFEVWTMVNRPRLAAPGSV